MKDVMADRLSRRRRRDPGSYSHTDETLLIIATVDAQPSCRGRRCMNASRFTHRSASPSCPVESCTLTIHRISPRHAGPHERRPIGGDPCASCSITTVDMGHAAQRASGQAKPERLETNVTKRNSGLAQEPSEMGAGQISLQIALMRALPPESREVGCDVSVSRCAGRR